MAVSRSKIIKGVFLGAAATVLLGGAYIHGIDYYSERFLPNTSIDGVDVSDMTGSEAQALLNDTFSIKRLAISGRNGAEEELDISNAGVSRVYKGIDVCLASQNNYAWIIERIKPKTQQIPFEYSCDENALLEAEASLKLMNSADVIVPENAYIAADPEQGSFVIVPEVEGNRIEPAVFHEKVLQAVKAGREALNLEEEECYRRPTIRTDDSILNEKLEVINRLQDKALMVDLGAETADIIPGDRMYEMLGGDLYFEAYKNGTYAGIPEDNTIIAEYVSGIAEKYNTYEPDSKKLFEKQDGFQVMIESSYGWLLNEEKTVESMRSAVDSIGNAVITGDEAAFEKNKAEGVYPYRTKAVWQKSAASHGKNDIGDYYAEINLTAQKVYIIDKGEKIFESDCVSGRMTKGRITPGGIYSVNYKQMHKVLTGYNKDGSVSYRSPVTYWMPFNKGIGFHDATWRSSFGGNIYINSGSHGCINLPFAKAKILWDLVYAGMPVILYYETEESAETSS